MEPISLLHSSSNTNIQPSVHFERIKIALKIIGIIGAVLASAVLIAGSIQFSALLLIVGGAALITFLALTIIGFAIKQKKNEAIHVPVKVQVNEMSMKDKALTSSAYLLAHMKDLRNSYKTHIDKANNVHPFFIALRVAPQKKKAAEFVINDLNLDQDKVVNLLKAAGESDVILHFDSLEIMAPLPEKEATFLAHKNIIQKSFDLSASFALACLEQKIPYKKINEQLKALAVKFLSPGKETRALIPSLLFQDRKTLIVNSHLGEIGDLQSVLEKLNVKGLKIIIQGRGFWKSANIDDLDSWKKYRNNLVESSKKTDHPILCKVKDKTEKEKIVDFYSPDIIQLEENYQLRKHNISQVS